MRTPSLCGCSSISAASSDFGQPVLRYGVPQHAARLGQGLEDSHVMARKGKVVGACEPCRARTDHRRLLACFLQLRRRRLDRREVRDRPLHVADRQGLVELPPVADFFAGRIADPPANGRERVRLPYEHRRRPRTCPRLHASDNPARSYAPGRRRYRPPCTASTCACRCSPCWGSPAERGYRSAFRCPSPC